MGLVRSKMIRSNNEDILSCLICWEKIDKKYIYSKCGICNISMHRNCSRQLFEGCGYTKCPQCSRVGVIYIA